MPVSLQTLPEQMPGILDERLGPALRELANQVWVVKMEEQRGAPSLGKPDQC